MKYLNTKPGSIEEVAAKMSKYAAESEYQDMFKKELEKAGKGIGAMTPAEKKAFFNKIDSKYKAKNEGATDKEIDTFHKKLDTLVHKSFGHSSDEKKKEMKNEKVDEPYAVGMATAMKATGDKPPLKKSTITKAHDIAKSIEKDQKEELNKDDENAVKKVKDMLTKASQAHASQAKELDKAMKSEEVKYPHKMYSKDGKEVEAKTPADHEKYAKMGYTHTKETHSFMTKDMNKSKKDAKGEKEIVDPEPKIKQESIQDAIKSVWQMSAEQLEKIKNEAKYMKAQRMDKYKGKADTGSDETKVELEPSVDYKN